MSESTKEYSKKNYYVQIKQAILFLAITLVSIFIGCFLAKSAVALCTPMECPAGQVQDNCRCVNTETLEDGKNDMRKNTISLLMTLFACIAISVVGSRMNMVGKTKRVKNSGTIISGIAIFLEIAIIAALFTFFKGQLQLGGVTFIAIVIPVSVTLLTGLILILNKNERARNIAKIMLLVGAPAFLALCCLL